MDAARVRALTAQITVVRELLTEARSGVDRSFAGSKRVTAWPGPHRAKRAGFTAVDPMAFEPGIRGTQTAIQQAHASVETLTPLVTSEAGKDALRNLTVKMATADKEITRSIDEFTAAVATDERPRIPVRGGTSTWFFGSEVIRPAFLSRDLGTDRISTLQTGLEHVRRAETFGTEVHPEVARSVAHVHSLAVEMRDMADHVAPMPAALTSPGRHALPAGPVTDSPTYEPGERVALSAVGRHAAAEPSGGGMEPPADVSWIRFERGGG